VVIADDMSASLALLEGVFRLEPGFEIAGRAKDGKQAVELTRSLRPDLVTMDIEMPVLNGFEATLQIMTECPTPILIVSGQDVSSVSFALNAMKAGALAVVPKPPAPGTPEFDAQARQLLPRVEAAQPAAPGAAARTRSRARVIAIAASTGGPPALSRILSELPADFRAPLLVVQHIAQGFADGLAKWLGAASRLRVKVAEEGEPLLAGTVYLAPDARHLGVSGDRIELSDAPPIEGFKPSGSHLFESVARSFGPAALGLILTGMGKDGVRGLAALRAAGGTVVAQDEQSSVIYGMNGEAVLGGLTDEVLPLDALAYLLMQAV
jgi:two-component system chemotaxis response regulator CheB